MDISEETNPILLGNNQKISLMKKNDMSLFKIYIKFLNGNIST